MGLLDILTGAQRGQPKAEGGGMSPIMVALLGLLAYKAAQGGGLGGLLGGRSAGGTPAGGTPGQPAPPASGGGLGDILGGMLGGGRPTASGGGGLGDILGGILGGGPGARGTGAGAASSATGGGGGLGDLLGGLLGSGAAGSVLKGGLDQVIGDLDRSGHGRTAQSWVGHGDNLGVAPDDLERALGADTISALSRETGMERDDLLHGLSQELPHFVDKLTPEGRLPTDEEASTRW